MFKYFKLALLFLSFPLLCAGQDKNHFNFKFDSSSVLKIYDMVKQMQSSQNASNQNFTKRNAEDSLRMAKLEKTNKELSAGMRSQKSLDSLRIKQLNDSLFVTTKKLGEMLSALQKYESTATQLGGIQQRFEKTDKERYEQVKNNVINTAKMLQELHAKISTLMAIKKQDDYQNMMLQLNNPASDNLGFSYNQKVLEILQKNITKAENKDNPKILQYVQLMLDNPFVATLKSVSPIIGTANSIVSFVSSLSLDRKDIQFTDLEKFKKELERYTQYYVGLNNINNNFVISIDHYQKDIQGLQTTLEHLFVEDLTLMAVKFKEKDGFKSKDYADYVSYLASEFDEEEVRKYFEKLEKDAKIKGGDLDYAKLLANKNIVDMNKNTEEVLVLFRSFETTYNKYFKIMDENSREITTLLKDVIEKQLSNTPAKVSNQITLLEKENEAVKSSISTAINISKMKKIADQLNIYFPFL